MSSVVTGTPPEASLVERPPAGSSRWVWLSVVLLLLLFAGLAYAAYGVPYFPMDLQATRAVQAIHASWFHSLMIAVSWPGFPPQVYIFVVIVSAGFYATRQKRAAIYLLVSSVAIATISQGVKLLVDRPRPSPTLVHVLIPNLNGGHWSFPAGHVESYVVIFGFIAYTAYTGWRNNLARGVVIVLALLMVALIGVSRIDSGEHWLSDVTGGYLLGGAFLLAMLAWYQRGRTVADRGPAMEKGPAG
jgi:undecaprenyl-diphosphatase